MKIIDLLNKIANGEIEYEQKIKIDNEIITVSHLLGAYIFSKERFNDEVEILEKEKKMPEKLDDFNLTTYSRDDEDLGLELNYTGVSNTFNDVYFKINEIIDYLKSKRDE